MYLKISNRIKLKNILAFFLLLAGLLNAQSGVAGSSYINTTANNIAYPQFVFVDSKSGNLWVADFDNNRILRFDVSTLTKIKENSGLEIPAAFSLKQNFPNPFNPATTIQFTIPVVDAKFASTTMHITLKVYDILGREVAILADEYKQAGTYKVTFNSRHLEHPLRSLSEARSQEIVSLPSGIYFYTLRAGDFFQTKKMVLSK